MEVSGKFMDAGFTYEMASKAYSVSIGKEKVIDGLIRIYTVRPKWCPKILYHWILKNFIAITIEND